MNRERSGAPRDSLPGLSSLLPDHDEDQFLREDWGRNWRHFEKTLDLISDAAALSLLTGIGEDVRSVSRLVSQPTVEIFDSATGDSPRTVSPAEAGRLLEQERCTVRLRRLDRCVPGLSRWLDAIADDLGATALRTVFMNGYSSSAGTSGVPHCDAHDNFLVQVRGRKRWEIVELEEVEMPVLGIELGRGRGGARRQGISRADLPRNVPGGAKDLTLEPGDVLYLPRGVFHSATTLEDSFHFTVGVSRQTWAELFAEVLSVELLRVPVFRRSPDGLLDPDRRTDMADRVDRLMSALRDHSEQFDAEALASDLRRRCVATSTRVHGTRFAVSRSADIEVDRRAEAPVLSVTTSPGRTRRVRVPPRYTSLLSQILEHPRPFTARVASFWADGLEPDTVEAVLEVLVRLRLLRRFDGTPATGREALAEEPPA